MRIIFNSINFITTSDRKVCYLKILKIYHEKPDAFFNCFINDLIWKRRLIFFYYKRTFLSYLYNSQILNKFEIPLLQKLYQRQVNGGLIKILNLILTINFLLSRLIIPRSVIRKSDRNFVPIKFWPYFQVSNTPNQYWPSISKWIRKCSHLVKINTNHPKLKWQKQKHQTYENEFQLLH